MAARVARREAIEEIQATLCPECRASLAATPRDLANGASQSNVAVQHGPRQCQVEQLLELAGAPWRFRQGWTRESWSAAFGPWPAAELAAWQPRTSGSLLLVIGPTSCGKTGLATLLLGEHLRAGESGYWARSQGLLDQARLAAAAERSGHGSALEYRLAALETERRCAAAEVLVLDDFFAAETHTAAEVKRLQGLVAQRYDEGELTVITTNRTAKQLKHLLPSLRSRLLSGVQILLDSPGGDRSQA